jgi:mono/diheme cytochrome c family protein
MFDEQATIQRLGRSFIAFAIFACLAVATVAAKEDKRAARDRALAEADQKALEENMTAFQRDVQPFLTMHCVSCHGPEKQKGDLALDLLDPDMKNSSSGARWATVREQLETGEMPPEKKPRPSSEELENVLAWIKAEMKRARRNFTRRLEVVHGNKVPHELLFDSGNVAELDVAPRVRRHSSELYEAFRKEQAKGFENLVGNPFTPDPRFLFHDMGEPVVDVPTTAQLLRNALTILERQTAHTIENGKLKPLPGAKKEFLPFVDPKQPFGKEEMEKAISMQFKRTLGRSPKADELRRFLVLMEKNVNDAGRAAGVRYTLAAVYLIPNTVFRWELGASPDEHGKARLRPEEIAHALAYTLTDQRPPDWLIAAAEKGELDDAAGVKATVGKMLADEKLRKPRILRFFHEYFEYPKAAEVFKNPEDFRFHNARVLVSDTDNLVRWILERDKDVLRELLTTDRSFVNTRYDSNKKTIVRYESNGEIHRSYSLPPDWKWVEEQPIEMPGGTRAGILTQPSWLVAWSMNQDNHAILRGKWIRERLLGNVVPDIPITVDAQLPEASQKTLRERMAVTREEYCWQCHKLMNPVGLPFETFDHFGRFRALELGRPVDAKGRIDLVSEADTSGDVEVTDAFDFVRKLAGSERVEQVFVRHVFRYFAGRNENLGDGPALRAAHQAYRDSGGSFQSLVAAILASDSFLYRTPATSAESDKLDPDAKKS